MTPEENTMHAHIEVGRLREAARSVRAMEDAVLTEFAMMLVPFKPLENETIADTQNRLRDVVVADPRTYREQAIDACNRSIYAAYCQRIYTDRIRKLQLRNEHLDHAVEQYHRSEADGVEHALNTDDKLLDIAATAARHQFEVVLLRVSLFCFVFVLSIFHLCGPPAASLGRCLYLQLMALLLSAFNISVCCIVCKIAFYRPTLVNGSRWPLQRPPDDCDRPAHELTGDSENSFEKRIIKFYATHSPSKLEDTGFASRIAARYSYVGGEAALFRTLNKRYLKQD